MKIKTVEATWLRVPVPEAEQVVSNLGRMTSFDSVLVRIETECGIVGYGEAKEEVGSVGDCHALALEPRTESKAWSDKLVPSLVHAPGSPNVGKRLWPA